jgi:putative membrane protein
MVDALAPVLLALGAAVYACGAQRCWATAGHGRIIRPPHVLAAAGAFTALLVALSSPFDRAAHHDLAAHMAQHVLLLSVVPPLLALAAPFTAALYALPGPVRVRAQPAWRHVLRAQSGRWWPAWTAVAFVVANVTVALWHLPGPYAAAVHHDGLHLLEHASFVATATLFWWAVLGAGRPARRGFGVLALFVASLPAAALGVLMTLATTSWYAPYGTGARAVRDQQLAGVVMWAFGGAALVIAACVLFATWLRSLEPSS